MQEIQPKVALQQLAVPLEDEKRREGKATLAQLAWASDDARLGMPRIDYMRMAREHLTAQEQVCLYATMAENRLMLCASAMLSTGFSGSLAVQHCICTGLNIIVWRLLAYALKMGYSI